MKDELPLQLSYTGFLLTFLKSFKGITYKTDNELKLLINVGIKF